MGNLEKWDSKQMLYEYDISIFVAIDNKKEIIYHIPNKLKIDYVSQKKVLLSQYKEVSIKYTSDQNFHKVICTKFN